MRLLRLVLPAALAALVAAAAGSAYPWPVKPFDRQHPIRGFFGDPRTVFENGVLAGGFDGPGFFSFHQGVDIAAPNGTPVYAVANGTTHYLGASVLNLDTGNDVIFQYFHITPVVGEGERVLVRRTILGYVEPPYAHVHLTEIDGIHAVNPLQLGHLTPYVDRTRPIIRDVVFENQTGVLETPLGLCGRVELVVDAFDEPPLRVPGSFGGLPASPALVRWTVGRVGGKTVIPWMTTADFRSTLPGNASFSNVYAKGTYENAPRFGAQQYTSMPGRYLFLLAGNFDTTSLPNGVYVLTVLAADVRGNRTFTSTRFSVLNARSGVCPGSLPAPPSGQPPPSEPPGGGQPGG
jgi:hypothetical protein